MAEKPQAISLATFVNGTVTVITNDGRHIVGILRGYDQTTNLVLEQCYERVYHTQAAVEQIPLGLYVVRGDNIAVVGEVDEDLDSSQDFDNIRAAPLKPIAH